MQLRSLSHRLWLVDTTTSLPTIGAVLLWSSFGVGVVFFMAGLASIDDSLMMPPKSTARACQVLRHVTIPGLAPVILFWAIQVVILSFTGLFAYIYSLTNGGPGYSTSVIEFAILYGDC